VDARERKRILGQWGVRGENALERREREILERDLEGNPYAGRAAPMRLRNFRPSADSYVASLGGPLPYMQRLREIEELTRAHEDELAEAWHDLAEECGDDGGERFARRWRSRAARRNFTEVNELIGRHNRFYPIEARLPMDIRRRDYVLVNGEPYSRVPLDAGWVLERFPADLAAARSSGLTRH
jgi:hypothetical protein